MDDIMMTPGSPTRITTSLLPQENDVTMDNTRMVRLIPFTPSSQTFYASMHPLTVLA